METGDEAPGPTGFGPAVEVVWPETVVEGAMLEDMAGSGEEYPTSPRPGARLPHHCTPPRLIPCESAMPAANLTSALPSSLVMVHTLHGSVTSDITSMPMTAAAAALWLTLQHIILRLS